MQIARPGIVLDTNVVMAVLERPGAAAKLADFERSHLLPIAEALEARRGEL